jgi:hypothetical protein
MADEIESLQSQLSHARENLALICERMSQYVLGTDVPLQLIKERRRLERQIGWLERRIDELRPINVLREATKLIVGPVAVALTGEPWKHLRQRFLTQASKLPQAAYLDTALMDEAVDDLISLTREVRVLLEAHRIEPGVNQLGPLQRRAERMTSYLVRIYRVERGDAPELESLAAGEL